MTIAKEASQAVKKATTTTPPTAAIKVKKSAGGVELSCMGDKVAAPQAVWEKFRSIHRHNKRGNGGGGGGGAGADAGAGVDGGDVSGFNADVFCMLLRYQVLGGPGFQVFFFFFLNPYFKLVLLFTYLLYFLTLRFFTLVAPLHNLCSRTHTHTQASIPAAGFTALRDHFGVEMELFASPLNCYHGSFCSAYADVDTVTPL
jgi:hypothetical protein